MMHLASLHMFIYQIDAAARAKREHVYHKARGRFDAVRDTEPDNEVDPTPALAIERRGRGACAASQCAIHLLRQRGLQAVVH